MVNVKNVHRLVVPNMMAETVEPDGGSTTTIDSYNVQYKTNRIHTSKYTWLTFLPKNLFQQFYRFANLYFLFIQILNWLPGMEVFVREVQLMPLLFVLSVTAIKDLFEDRRRHLSDKRVNNMTTRRYDRLTKQFVQIKWQEIQVGDLIHLSCNEIVPADILLLRSQSADNQSDNDNDGGICYVETSNLDGESNLKARYVVPNVIKPSNQPLDKVNFDFTIHCEPPNLKLHKFNGSIIYNNNNDNNNCITINKDNLLLRDCSLRNSGFAQGLVIYAGHETKAMLNNKGARHKRSRLEKMMNRDIIMCVVILIIMCVVGSMGKYFWLDQFTHLIRLRPPYTDYNNPIESLDFMWPLKTFATFLILYQMIIPISLYVCIEMIKLGQIYLINRDQHLIDTATGKRCECRAWNITEDLGQIQYVFCDKTGTLTENVMEFQCCCIKGINYEFDAVHNNENENDNGHHHHHHHHHHRQQMINRQLQNKVNNIQQQYLQWKQQQQQQLLTSCLSFNDDQQQAIHDFFITLAICNSATKSIVHQDNLNSNNQQQQQSTTTKTMLPCYESESADEVALVTAAYHYRYQLIKRTRDAVIISLADNVIVRYKILLTIPFDSDRKRMSVIVECPFTGNIILYTKGSDMTILKRLKTSSNDHNIHHEITMNDQYLQQYSSQGLRVLCIAKTILNKQQFQQWLLQLNQAESMRNDKLIKSLYDQIENNLQLLGTTAIEDRLQHRVPQVIQSLRQAGIIVWVLTGDKMETAISIAKSCKLFSQDVHLLTISSVRSKRMALSELLKHMETIRKEKRELSAFNVSLSTEKLLSHNDNKRSDLLRRIYHFLKRDKQAFSGSHSSSSEYDDLVFDNCNDYNHQHRYGLVIDGPSLNFVLQKENVDHFIRLAQCCGSVLCCRVTPSQKSLVVKCVKNKLNVLTLAIGDGANDVAMIQTAAIGVGVVGLEGSQAAMASDFAIPKFHFLERLILLHGNLCYNRLSLTILYFFYKNTMVVFVLFFYQFMCGFSGTSLLDEIYLMAVNIFYTTLPAIVRGILEKDAENESLFIQHPYLYERGRRSMLYTPQSFWITTIDSVYQSSVIYYISYAIFNESTIGINEFGLILTILIVITNLLQIMMETKYWNRYFVISLLISIGFFLSSVLFLDFNYSESLLSILGGGRNYKLLTNIVFEVQFIRAMFVIPVMCLMPHFAIRTLLNMIKPQFQLKSTLH